MEAWSNAISEGIDTVATLTLQLIANLQSQGPVGVLKMPNKTAAKKMRAERLSEDRELQAERAAW